MKKSIKKTAVALMAAAIITTSTVAAPLFNSVTVEAASQVSVTNCNAPLRPQPYQSSGEIMRIPAYSTVIILSSYVNDYGNTWYYVEYWDPEDDYHHGWVYEYNLYI